MSKKRKKFAQLLSYLEYLLILVSTITGCISISVVASFIIASSTVGLKAFAISAGIKKHKSVIKKRRRSMIK